MPMIPIDMIETNKDQPRKTFPQEGMDQLERSIKHQGLIQPITVVAEPDGRFGLVAGERRFRACCNLGWSEIPVTILSEEKFRSGKTTLEEVAIAENLHREDLTPLEEAQAYKDQIRKHELTQKQVAQRLGKSAAYVAERLALLDLPPEVQELVLQRKISFSQAKVLARVTDPDDAAALAKSASENKTPVRALNDQVTSLKKASSGKRKPTRNDSFSKARELIAQAAAILFASNEETRQPALRAVLTLLSRADHHLKPGRAHE